jgi:hypothetical protein
MLKFANEKIGQFSVRAILANPGMKNEQILGLVREQFPEAKTTVACIAWYKSDLKKNPVMVAPEVSLETIDQDIKDLLEKLDEKKAERAAFLDSQKAKKAEMMAKLKEELEALMKEVE